MTRPLPISLACLVLAILFSSPVRGANPAPCPRCNVLLLTFDTLRADHLGSYGYDKPTSPALDALAQRSSVFLDNASQSGSTISSIPSMLTGRFPHIDRLLTEGKLRPIEETLAEMLQRAGYETMAVIAHDYAGCAWQFCQGFDKVDEDFKLGETAAATLQRVRRMLDAYKGEKPFFLWVHFRVPHGPYNPGAKLFELFYDGKSDTPRFYQGPLAKQFIRDQIRTLRKLHQQRGEIAVEYQALGGRLELTPSLVEQLGALYDGNIRSADDAYGALEADLPPATKARTVIVVASDHGESLGEHGLVGHNTLHQAVIQTPLIIHVPGRPPERIETPTMNIDILPTVLAAIGQPIPPSLRGVDLLAGPPPADRAQIAEYRVGQSIVRRPWKLVLRENQNDILYNLTLDPGESNDVSAQHPAIVAELKAELTRLESATPAETQRRTDTDVLQKLRALGYISDDDPTEKQNESETPRSE